MTPDKVREVLKIYSDRLDFCDTVPQRHLPDKRLHCTRCGNAHCKYMIDQVKVFLDEGRIEKAMRWLGFIQGFLWAMKEYTLDELKEHNRPIGTNDDKRKFSEHPKINYMFTKEMLGDEGEQE